MSNDSDKDGNSSGDQIVEVTPTIGGGAVRTGEQSAAALIDVHSLFILISLLDAWQSSFHRQQLALEGEGLEQELRRTLTNGHKT